MTAPDTIEAHFLTVALQSFTQQEIDDDGLWSIIHDDIEEFRSGTHKTGLDCDFSRHYSSEAVAAKIGDQWIGWTHFFGGGKHGEPSECRWVEDAYFLDAVEVMEPVLKFTKRT